MPYDPAVKTGPLGGRYKPGKPKNFGQFIVEPFRELNRAVTDKIGALNDWMNGGWSSGTGFNHPSTPTPGPLSMANAQAKPVSPFQAPGPTPIFPSTPTPGLGPLRNDATHPVSMPMNGSLNGQPGSPATDPNAGLRAGVANQQALNAAAAARPVMPYQSPFAAGPLTNEQAINEYRNPESSLFGRFPNTTVGGAFGTIGATPQGVTPQIGGGNNLGLGGYQGGRLDDRQVLSQATGNQYAPMGAAADSTRGGTLFNGAMPGTIGGKPAWVGGPTQPRPDYNPIASAHPQKQTSESDIQAARELFNARRGGLEARRKDYETRTALDHSERQTKKKAYQEARGEARRIGSGQMTFDERLAAINPAADAQRRVGEGQIAAASEQAKARNAIESSRITSAENIAKGRNDAMTQMGRDRISAAAIEAGVPDPFGKPSTAAPPIPSLSAPSQSGAPAVPPAVQQKVRETANAGDTDTARQLLANSGVTDKATQDKALEEATGNPYLNSGFWGQPAGGIFSHPEAVTRGDAVSKTFMDAGRLFGFIPGRKKASSKVAAKAQ